MPGKSTSNSMPFNHIATAEWRGGGVQVFLESFFPATTPAQPWMNQMYLTLSSTALLIFQQYLVIYEPIWQTV